MTIHPAIKAAASLGCYVGLFTREKGKVIGIEAVMLSIETGKVQCFKTRRFIGADVNEAMDKLYARIKEVVG